MKLDNSQIEYWINQSSTTDYFIICVTIHEVWNMLKKV